MDSPTQIRFESTRLRKSPVVYDPTTSLARFERDMKSDRERRYAWSERRARRKLNKERHSGRCETIED